jgi:hypothetical protein
MAPKMVNVDDHLDEILSNLLSIQSANYHELCADSTLGMQYFYSK